MEDKDFLALERGTEVVISDAKFADFERTKLYRYFGENAVLVIQQDKNKLLKKVISGQAFFARYVYVRGGSEGDREWVTAKNVELYVKFERLCEACDGTGLIDYDNTCEACDGQGVIFS